MPVLTRGTAPAITNLAERLAADFASGSNTRQSLGAKDAAFGWLAGMPSTVAPHVSSGIVAGLSFTALMVTDSGTPAAVVGPGVPKPAAITLGTTPVTLKKYAGQATWNLESSLSTDSLAFAVSQVVIRQIVKAYDVDVVAALDAATTPVTADTTWHDAILGAYGTIAGDGGNPAVLVISPADYAAVLAPSVGYDVDPTSGRGMLYGLEIVISAACATGTAYVLDPSAVLAVEQEAGPLALLDPYSGSGSNKIALVLDYLAGVLVTAAYGVAAVTPTIAATASARHGR